MGLKPWSWFSRDGGCRISKMAWMKLHVEISRYDTQTVCERWEMMVYFLSFYSLSLTSINTGCFMLAGVQSIRVSVLLEDDVNLCQPFVIRLLSQAPVRTINAPHAHDTVWLGHNFHTICWLCNLPTSVLTESVSNLCPAAVCTSPPPCTHLTHDHTLEQNHQIAC